MVMSDETETKILEKIISFQTKHSGVVEVCQIRLNCCDSEPVDVSFENKTDADTNGQHVECVFTFSSLEMFFHVNVHSKETTEAIGVSVTFDGCAFKSVCLKDSNGLVCMREKGILSSPENVKISTQNQPVKDLNQVDDFKRDFVSIVSDATTYKPYECRNMSEDWLTDANVLENLRGNRHVNKFSTCREDGIDVRKISIDVTSNGLTSDHFVDVVKDSDNFLSEYLHFVHVSDSRQTSESSFVDKWLSCVENLIVVNPETAEILVSNCNNSKNMFDLTAVVKIEHLKIDGRLSMNVGGIKNVTDQKVEICMSGIEFKLKKRFTTILNNGTETDDHSLLDMSADVRRVDINTDDAFKCIGFAKSSFLTCCFRKKFMKVFLIRSLKPSLSLFINRLLSSV